MTKLSVFENYLQYLLTLKVNEHNWYYSKKCNFGLFLKSILGEKEFEKFHFHILKKMKRSKTDSLGSWKELVEYFIPINYNSRNICNSTGFPVSNLSKLLKSIGFRKEEIGELENAAFYLSDLITYVEQKIEELKLQT